MIDDQQPKPDQWCDVCQQRTDHFACSDTDLDLSDFAPQVELHDAALRVERGAA